MNLPTAFAALALNTAQGVEPLEQCVHAPFTTEHHEPYREQEPSPLDGRDPVDIPREREHLDMWLAKLVALAEASSAILSTAAEVSSAQATVSNNPPSIETPSTPIRTAGYTFPHGGDRASSHGKVRGPQRGRGKHQAALK